MLVTLPESVPSSWMVTNDFASARGATASAMSKLEQANFQCFVMGTLLTRSGRAGTLKER